MKEQDLTHHNQNSGDSKPIIVDDIIKANIKLSPPIDKNREDLKRGEGYYSTGGDPDERSPI